MPVVEVFYFLLCLYYALFYLHYFLPACSRVFFSHSSSPWTKALLQKDCKAPEILIIGKIVDKAKAIKEYKLFITKELENWD
jgi:hypothetical protein